MKPVVMKDIAQMIDRVLSKATGDGNYTAETG